MRRVVVTGLGLVSPLGVGVPVNWANLICGKSGLLSLTASEYSNLPCRVAAVVPESAGAVDIPGCFNWNSFMKKSERSQVSRGTAFGLKAAEEAWEDAGLETTGESEREGIGVAVGMGVVDLDEVYATGCLLQEGKYNKISPFFVPRILTNMVAGHISIRYKLRGPNHSVSTACTTGAHAIGDAFSFIRHGYAEVCAVCKEMAMVCGGAEACISPIALGGFARCRALSRKFNEKPAEASRPFDKERDGFIMGEGAGIVILESLEHARSRNMKQIYAEVIGYGLSGDGFHVTSPDEEGRGAQLCMERALEDAGCCPEDIGYVNAHATSTPLGDKVESAAIEKVIGRTAVSSSKGSIGHLLGAAGSVEAVHLILTCFHGKIPFTLNLTETDCSDKLDYVKDVPMEWAGKGNMRTGLSNSFGFGGTNACLCIRNFED